MGDKWPGIERETTPGTPVKPDSLDRYLARLTPEERQEILDNTLIGASYKFREAWLDLFVRPLLPILTQTIDTVTALIERMTDDDA